jgi:phage gpG-like protein
VSGGAGGGAGIPYAKIHEFGGTIHHPGGTAYFIGQDGMATFVSNASALADRLPRTKPHSIPIPERSYMRSAFEERAPSGIEQLRGAVRAAIAA